MKLKAFAILFIILVSLIPVYLFNRYLQKMIRPKESLAKLLAYLLAGCAMVFIYTFLVVLVIKSIFPGA